MALCWTLDKLGPMCRSADDCGLVLAAIAGKDPNDPTTEGSFSYGATPKTTRRFRIGVLKHATERAQPEVKANFEASLEVLRSFTELTADVELPDFPFGPAHVVRTRRWRDPRFVVRPPPFSPGDDPWAT